VRRELRDRVVFAPQDLTLDAPFSGMDLITCRNVLIYLKKERQAQIFRLLHFALRPGGFLMLGSSESTMQGDELFQEVSKHGRIYRSRDVPRRFLELPRRALGTGRRNPLPAASAGAEAGEGFGRSHVRMAVEPFAPETKAPPGPAEEPESAEHHLVKDLEDELQNARLELRTTVEQLEASNEDLRSSNEEVMSMNEELRSTNEELEASKEELQAMNEELSVLNQQLGEKVQELREANNDLKNLLASTEIATVFLDPDLAIRRFTPSASRLVRTIDSDVGRPFEDLAWRFRDDALLDDARAVLAGHNALRREIQAEDGRWYQRRVLPYRDPDGDVAGVVVTFADVTDLKDAQRALALNEERFRMTLDGSPIVVFQQDRELRYTWIHNVTIGVSAGEVIGKTDRELFGDRAEPLDELKRRVLATGDALREEVEIPVDGDDRVYDMTVRPLYGSGEVTGIMCSATDVTARKRAEQALLTSESRLREQAAELEEADRRKNEFLAMLAHELRNPMYPIRNASELLTRTAASTAGCAGPLATWWRGRSAQLTRLVDDLLDVSRITRTGSSCSRQLLEVGVVVELAVETVESMLDRAVTRWCSWRASRRAGPRSSATWRGSPRCFANLLSNAAKFTEPGSHRAVRGVAGDRARNRGQRRREGIAAEGTVPKVFDLFTQADRTLDRSEGGLGSASRWCVASSRCTAARSLPRATAPATARRSASSCRWRSPPVNAAVEVAEPTTAAVRRLLVVDDNVDAADSLAELLRLAGHQAVAVYGAREAIERAVEFDGDVILLDIGLPEMDGYEVARRLRAEVANSDLRLVALTGYGQEENRQRSRDAGFDHHLLKPASLEKIRAVLR
jgi:two-component system, chemotaxis family, CheB/CheR fusion protein